MEMGIFDEERKNEESRIPAMQACGAKEKLFILHFAHRFCIDVEKISTLC
jgi:hypothetical protein